MATLTFFQRFSSSQEIVYAFNLVTNSKILHECIKIDENKDQEELQNDLLGMFDLPQCLAFETKSQVRKRDRIPFHKYDFAWQLLFPPESRKPGTNKKAYYEAEFNDTHD